MPKLLYSNVWTAALAPLTRPGQVEVVKALIATGADVNAAFDGKTPLDMLKAKLTEILSTQGTSTNERATLGFIIIGVQNYITVAKLLIGAGANDATGTTLSDLATLAKENTNRINTLKALPKPQARGPILSNFGGNSESDSD